MTAWFEGHAADFDAFDAEAIAARFHVPCLMVNDEYTALLPTPDAVLANMRDLCAYHEAQGYGQAQVVDVRVQETSPDVCFATVDWKIDHREGHTLWAFTNTYQLTRHGGDWRILSSTTHGEA